MLGCGLGLAVRRALGGAASPACPNLVSSPRTFTGPYWAFSGVSIGTATESSPLGGLMTTQVLDSLYGYMSHNLADYDALTTMFDVEGGWNTMSAYAKAGTAGGVMFTGYVELADASGNYIAAVLLQIVVDLSDGSVSPGYYGTGVYSTTSDAGSTNDVSRPLVDATELIVGATDVGGGVYRIRISFKVPSDGRDGYPALNAAASFGRIELSPWGVDYADYPVPGETTYIDGVQVERGSSMSDYCDG